LIWLPTSVPTVETVRVTVPLKSVTGLPEVG
jgi:hypothetical protein